MADPQQNPQNSGTQQGQQGIPPAQDGTTQQPAGQQPVQTGATQTQGAQQMPPVQQTPMQGGMMPPPMQPQQMQQQPGMMPPQGIPAGYYPYGMQPQNMGQPMPGQMPMQPQQMQQPGMMPPQGMQPMQGMYQPMPQYPQYAPGGYPQPGMMGMGAGTPPPPPGGFAGDDFGGSAGGAGAQPQKLSNFRFGEWQKNFTTTITIPAHSLKFDESYFLKLLAGSISLTRDEKKRIIESVPKLRQQQIDELIRIFEEEKTKFIELSPKHGDQLEKLEKKHREDWRDLETVMVQEGKKQEDTAKADEIRKKLGLA